MAKATPDVPVPVASNFALNTLLHFINLTKPIKTALHSLTNTCTTSLCAVVKTIKIITLARSHSCYT